jgi:hypothetical protein
MTEALCYKGRGAAEGFVAFCHFDARSLSKKPVGRGGSLRHPVPSLFGRIVFYNCFMLLCNCTISKHESQNWAKDIQTISLMLVRHLLIW